ncbi:MAG: VWA domain-containing protein [Caldithrix sp.]|nr:VWA domain-containing protein [Caldithrix sp.]
MLTFINSIVLPGLIAVTVPLLIHFFYRRKTKKVYFSSLRFLKQIENKRMRHVRIYQILLIILRTLFILFLVLAFARPALQSSFFGETQTARTTAILILDDSYSMRAYSGSQTSADRLVSSVNRVIKSFNTNDQIFILSGSDSTLFNFQNTTKNNNINLEEIYKPTYGTSDWDKTFKKAQTILKEYPNYNREIYLFSDYLIPTAQFKDSLANLDARLYQIDVYSGSTLRNISIDSVIIKERLLEVGQPVHFSVRLTNFHTREKAQSVISLFNGQTRVAMQQVELNASESRLIELNFTPRHSGHQFLTFELDDDDLMVDNNYFLNMFIKDKINLLFVDGNPENPLRTALQILSDQSNIVTEFTDYVSAYGMAIQTYDVLILNSLQSTSNALRQQIQSFVKNGKGVMLIPGGRFSLDDINEQWRSIVGRNLYTGENQLDQPQNFYTIEKINARHPIFADLFMRTNQQISTGKVFRYQQIAHAFDGILSLSNGDYFIAEQRRGTGGGRILLFASALDANWTDFPFKGAFIPALHRLIFYCSQRTTTGKPLLVNQSKTLRLSKIQLDTPLNVSFPDGQQHNILPDNGPSGMYITFDQDVLNQPGHYQLKVKDEIIEAFSVNHHASELQPPYINLENMSGPTYRLTFKDDLVEQVKEARIGTELWRIFLILALLMLTAEMALIKRIEGDK